MVELFAILAFQLVFEPTICSFMIFVTTYSTFLMLRFSTSSCCWLCLGSGSFGRVRISLGHVLDSFLLFFLRYFFFHLPKKVFILFFAFIYSWILLIKKIFPIFCNFKK